MFAKKKKAVIFIIVLFLILFLTAWTIWGNFTITTTTYTITSSKLPNAFNEYRIAHISDLHNAEMGKDNQNLLTLIKNSQPDMIALTGDLIDSRNTNVEIALKFVEEAVKIAPCYYVTGNHESRVEKYEKLKQGLIKIGVTVLEDERVVIEKLGEKISVIGINDPSFNADLSTSDETVTSQKLQNFTVDKDVYTILLSHRPELFNTYVNNEVDLVFSGHAHGGQFRIPFIGGLAAPNQGLLPKYDAGVFTSENTNMIVSRGIGNSIFPFRLNNNPELVIIDLKTA